MCVHRYARYSSVLHVASPSPSSTSMQVMMLDVVVVKMSSFDVNLSPSLARSLAHSLSEHLGVQDAVVLAGCIPHMKSLSMVFISGTC